MHDNYLALIARTDNGWTQAGHDFVVLYASKLLAEVLMFRRIYSGVSNLPEMHVVRLCSDSKAVVGSLVCEDEFNYGL
jgi:hypothetical protein